jgi:DNA-directed RNA polymerase specialized sigma24 family protein
VSTSVETDRRLLMGICYRLLGSVSDADDAVQETYARWYALSVPHRDEIASLTAWLTTTASRICLDVLNSARVKRVAYVGQWLPEWHDDNPYAGKAIPASERQRIEDYCERQIQHQWKVHRRLLAEERDT